MRYEKRSNKNSSEAYYSFIWYNQGKQKRMSRDEIRNRFGRDITTEDEAKKCIAMLEAEFESEKQRVQKILDWKNKYYRFDELLNLYVKKQKKKAPNSWKNNYHYLAHYVLPFFLSDERKISNVLLWYNYFEDFRDYLEKDAKLIRSDKSLSYGSKNHAIKALNTFLSYLFQDGILDTLRQCEYFEEHLLSQRTVEDVVSKEEFQKISDQLIFDGHQIEADLYKFLYFTGMRINEAAGISLADVFPGKIEKKAFDNRLKMNNIEYYGYILLKSQPAGENRTIRDRMTNIVLRKPLKGRHLISEKDCRIVPIIDKSLWDILMKRMKEQHQQWKEGIYGSNSSNYLLFDGYNRSTSLVRLKSAYEKTKIRLKTWHCLRHTRGTELFGETGDRELAKMWLGHGSDKVFERYNHTYEEMIRSNKRSGLKINEGFDDWFFGDREVLDSGVKVPRGWKRLVDRANNSLE